MEYEHLNNKLMPATIKLMFTYFQDSAMYNFIPELLESTLFFNTAVAMQAINTRIIRSTNNGIKQILPVYNGLILGPSGCGKNHSLDLTGYPFKKVFDHVVQACEEFAESDNNLDDEGKLLKCYVKMTSIYQPVSSTSQALQKAAQVFRDLGKGSVNVYSDELADDMGKMEEIFTKLKQAYDTGTSYGALLAGDNNYFKVEDVAFNSMLLGSPMKFHLKPKLKEDLLSHYVSGIARRFFIFHNSEFRKSQNKNKFFESMNDDDLKQANDLFYELRSHIRHNSEITYPAATRAYLMQWDDEKQLERENSSSPIADDIGAPNKIERLAGIIATLDLSSTITIDHMKYAIDYSTRVDKTAEDSVEIKPLYQQIYDELSKRGFISRTELIKQIRGLTAAIISEQMKLVIEHANEVGNSIVEKSYSGIIKYKLERLTETQMNRMIISINDDPSPTSNTGWQRKSGKWENLHKIICSNLRYSAGTFLNGAINKKNYESEQNLLMFDFDDGELTIEDTKSLFYSIKYLIATTKSHQIDKNNLVCDRFRLVIPTLSTFHLSSEEYTKLYKHLLASLGLHAADPKTSDSSRWYFGAPEATYYYNDNPEATLLDVRPFIDNSAENQEGTEALDKYTSESVVHNSGDEDELSRRLDGAFRWFLSRTSEGNRNDMMFRFGAMVKEKLPGSDFESAMMKFNHMIKPIGNSEMKTIISSVQRNV